MHPVFIVEGKDAVRPLVLKPVNQFLQHSHGPGYETVGSQGLQACLVLLIVFFDEVVDTYGRITVRHVESTAWGQTNTLSISSLTSSMSFYLPNAASL